jgi:hypothetical protein
LYETVKGEAGVKGSDGEEQVQQTVRSSVSRGRNYMSMGDAAARIEGFETLKPTSLTGAAWSHTRQGRYR